MPNCLTDSQATVLRTIFSSAPDSAITSLECALAGEVERGGAMASVHALVSAEAGGRRLRGLVFHPMVPLCKPTENAGPRFPPQILSRLWTALRASSPAGVRAAESLGPIEVEEDRIHANEVCDALCRFAAEGVRTGRGPYEAAKALLDSAAPDGAETFAKFLDLAPLARHALAKMPEWMGRLTEERAVELRLAYNDAVDVAEDAGPRLLDILGAHMAEPWKVLHLICAVMDRPTDRFAASSEIARFGEAIMDDIDRRLNWFRAFEADGGRATGVAAAETLRIASMEIAEFETSLDLSRDGVWGARIGKQKQSLAQLAETRLAKIDKALDAALPVQLVKFGKGLRGFPNLNDDPQALALLRAECLLSFFEQSRAAANQAGYGSARTKTGERLDSRLEQYVEDLLEMLRADEVKHYDRVRAYLDAAATLIGVARGEKAAQIVRRRAAA